MHKVLKFIFGIKFYMFRTVPLYIIRSYALYTQQWYMSYRFADSLWQLASQLSANLYVLLFVQCRTPDDRQRNCSKHAEFYSKNKFEKLVYLVGFITKIVSPTYTFHSKRYYSLLQCHQQKRNLHYHNNNILISKLLQVLGQTAPSVASAQLYTTKRSTLLSSSVCRIVASSSTNERKDLIWAAHGFECIQVTDVEKVLYLLDLSNVKGSTLRFI